MSVEAEEQTVHAPLARWAVSRAQVPAITDGQEVLTFAELHEQVQQHAAGLNRAGAAPLVFVDDTVSVGAQLVAFLGIVTSGRCAAVGDPDWPTAVRAQVRADTLAAVVKGSETGRAGNRSLADAPFYVGFTSGSTGQPKGFVRHHRSWVESFRVCLSTFGADAAARVLAPGRVSHSLFLFGMLLGVWSGAGVVVQGRFSAARGLDELRQGCTPCLVAVPSQLLMMLEWAAHRVQGPIAGVRLVLISGARWMRHRTTDLQALFPEARIVEFYGASETSFIAWMDAQEEASPQVVGRPFANVDIDIRDPSGPQRAGLIFVRSPMLFMGYCGGGSDGTAALREGEWLSVRDMGYLDDRGRLCLVGRQNRMIVTQGKNLFPEEVEAVLCAHPNVAQASVGGVSDPVRGQQVVAWLLLTEGDGAVPSASALQAWCRQRLESYKVPRRFWVCNDWSFTASGKTDHGRVAQMTTPWQLP
jgi:long-chain acyl-CoA synthetase